MKEYDRPMMSEMNIITEGVYAGSGTPTTPPTTPPDTPPDTPPESWTFDTRYDGHDGGTLSVLHIDAYHHGTKSGSQLKMDINIPNCTLIDVKNASGLLISNKSENGFTLTRNNTYNGNESVGFNVEVVVKHKDGSQGCVGALNESHCKASVVNYSCS